MHEYSIQISPREQVNGLDQTKNDYNVELLIGWTNRLATVY